MMRVFVVFSTCFLGSVLSSGYVKRKFIKQPLSPPTSDPSFGIVRSKLECATICGRELTMYTMSFDKTTKHCYCSATTQGSYLDLSVKEKMEGCLSNPGYQYDVQLAICYRVEGTTLLKGGSAKTQCESEGGHLVRIINEAVSDFIHALVTDPVFSGVPRFYIDGSDAETDGIWKFSNGVVMDWDNWAEDKTGTNENCLVLGGFFQFRWADVDCATFSGGYVCQISV